MKNRSRCFEIRGTETAGKISACSHLLTISLSCGMWYYITESEPRMKQSVKWKEKKRKREGKEKEKR
ncbi:hypothetical protein B6K86_02190 [Lachnospiraceae bacterium]|nr:hypothetical protein B6K86_02190 [Lachnospiraceae bacterium]